MRVLISADMEGVGGVVDREETGPGRRDYERARRLMTGEVNAAVEGVLAARPEASVRVADAHGPFTNILVEDLDPRARLIRGKPRPLGMVEGLRDGADALLFVGYHARASAGPAVIAHTMSGNVLHARVNGEPRGEIGLNALIAGSLDVPVLMCAGDDVACAEYAGLVPGGVTVETKRAIGQCAAETVHPSVSRDLIRAGAAEAVTRHGSVEPLRLDGPVELEMDVHPPVIVDRASLIPGVSRVDGRTVRFTAADCAEAYRVMQLVVMLGSVPS